MDAGYKKLMASATQAKDIAKLLCMGGSLTHTHTHTAYASHCVCVCRIKQMIAHKQKEERQQQLEEL